MRFSGGPPILALVGAGRVGSALGRRLHQKGWRVGSVVTRSMRTARAARRRIGSGKPQAGLSEAVLAADVILIATPDRAIAKTAQALARLREAGSDPQRQRQKRAWHRRVGLHTSGALACDVLAPVALQVAPPGSLHSLPT